MPTHSSLATLVAVLVDVCLHAHKQQYILSKGEAATRSTLIDPVLRALGWNTADAGMVEPEHTSRNKLRIDYALKGSDGKIKIGIEAKKLGENIESEGCFAQALSYAITLKASQFFITDGLNWHYYSTNQLGSPITKTKLSIDNLWSNATQLLKLLDAAHSGHGLPVEIPKLEAQIAIDFAQVQRDRLQLKHQLPAQPSRSELEVLAALPVPMVINTERNYRKLTPKLTKSTSGRLLWLRLPDNTEHRVKSWRDILKKSVEFILDSQPNISLPIYDKRGEIKLIIRSKRRYNYTNYIHTEHSNMIVSIYSPRDTSESVTNALYILKLLPKERQLVEPAVVFTS